MNIREAIRRNEREAVAQAKANQSRRARRHVERAEHLRIVAKIRREMRS